MTEFVLDGARFALRRLANMVVIVGRITLLYAEMIVSVPARFPWAQTIDQMDRIGVGSLGLVFVVSLFTGGVAALQAAYQFSSVVPLKYIGAVILRSVIIELGPVLTALVLAGRVGAGITAELGTMKVTEQVDAMRAMGINPVRFLVAPRIIAGTLMLPIVTIFANMIAIFGGFMVAVGVVGVSSATYVNSLKDFFYVKDLISGLIKAVFFGNIIATMGCYFGFTTEGGAEGVGTATTRAVVSACVLILIVDYLLATVLFRVIFTES
jgi:phospholipid/cholesterol/gamma-HCH transport system permease protein